MSSTPQSVLHLILITACETSVAQEQDFYCYVYLVRSRNRSNGKILSVAYSPQGLLHKREVGNNPYFN